MCGQWNKAINDEKGMTQSFVITFSPAMADFGHSWYEGTEAVEIRHHFKRVELHVTNRNGDFSHSTVHEKIPRWELPMVAVMLLLSSFPNCHGLRLANFGRYKVARLRSSYLLSKGSSLGEGRLGPRGLDGEGGLGPLCQSKMSIEVEEFL